MNIFKIALPGNDVKDSRLNQEVLNSLYPSPKVSTIATPAHAGIIFLNWQTTTTIPRGTIRTIYSFPHGYTQIPTALGAFTFFNGTTTAKGVLPFQYGNLGLIALDTDSTNVNLKYISFDGGSNPIPAFIMRIRFYVFAERGFNQ